MMMIVMRRVRFRNRKQYIAKVVKPNNCTLLTLPTIAAIQPCTIYCNILSSSILLLHSAPHGHHKRTSLI
jgi:hypothetical protein